ncbi:immunoglobulin-like and fibronectin type III domain-containing protein 1 [Boleophthalmus pectinirostris]|uniref:immunoglobulin-like and fibronectin type III domain-containing protein 1 n=1 Tax=Boleophthalmus pectinirostris TaxID=150288 RepID=UPI00242B978F|nr:immunoglobulin-like and fibronectin type III domain-containing protein 1 [Boleophthalmus pectinirostris]
MFVMSQDGVMVPFTKEECEGQKHSLKQVGKKFVFTIKGLGKDDAGLYSVDVGGCNVFSTNLKAPDVEFAVKIQEVKAEERGDAMFQCVLTAPYDELKWFGKKAPLSHGEKFEITMSEDKLIHTLIIRDCAPLDGGIYAAVAGVRSCNAWLIVEADKDPKGKKGERKTTMAGALNAEELARIAKEQQERYEKEMAEKIEKAKQAQAEQEVADAAAKLEAEEAKKQAAEAKAAALAEAKAEAKAKKAAKIAAARAAKEEAARRRAGGGGEGGTGADRAAGAAGEGELDGELDDEELSDSEKEHEGAGGGAAGDGAGGADSAEGEEGEGGDGEEKGKGKRKKKRAGPLVPDTVIGDDDEDIDEETAKQQGKAARKGKRAKKRLEEAEAAAVGDEDEDIDDETAKQQGQDARKGKRAKKRLEEAEAAAAAVGDDDEDIDDETAKQQGKDARKGKRAKKRLEEAEAAAAGAGAVGDDDEDIDDETAKQQGKDARKGKPAKKRLEEAEAAAAGAVGDDDEDIDDETAKQQGKDSRKGKRAKKRLEEAEAAAAAEAGAVDPGVHFHAGLSDCKAIMGEAAELECKLSSEECKGIWYKDGEEIKEDREGVTITQEGSFHRLKIHKVTEEFGGKYKFEADGRKTEAMIVVEDPPRFVAEDLETFKTPVTVKKGHKATFKLPFVGREPIKVQWYLEGEELSDDSNIKIEHTEGCSRLLLTKLQRKDSGEVKIKLKNEFGTVEALSELIVLDKPTPPMGPLEIVEATASVIDFKWRPPKDSGGCKIDNYILERNQVGRNTWKKLGPIGPEAKYRDSDVDHGRRYCYRIRVETEMGTSELMETEDIQAGTKAYPGQPSAPKVVSAFKDCINLTWSPPANTGGTNILGYNLEKRKKGSNLWSAVNKPDEMIRSAKLCPVKDVVEGMEYEFRVAAINNSGAGEFSVPSEFVFARDPKKPPGKVLDFKVTDSTYTTLSLSWTKPKDIEGEEDEAKGYFVEVRPAENTDWDRCNTNAITMTSYTVKGLKSMGMYWVRIIATNEGGDGLPQELDNYILAMPPPVRPRFTDAKIKSFMIVRAGNSARFNINFEASPWPEVTWLKDGVPVSKKVTISNAEGMSQLLIPSAERSDTGIYTIVVKNIVGQETFSIEIRVTDEPKPPGPVDLDENVPGTVTISWSASPDEKKDDRLHYMVTKRDSHKRQWHTVADRIFNNKFTACNIMPGREYQFRVYAKNDMGSSKPSESTKWLIPAKKEKFTVNLPESKSCDLQCMPKFIMPLKMHAAPQGYECYMSCAIKGDPTPHVTWYRNNISLNTNTNYFISNTCGVCSMLILRVGPKDSGEYKIVAENPLGRAECTTKLTVRE